MNASSPFRFAADDARAGSNLDAFGSVAERLDVTHVAIATSEKQTDPPHSDTCTFARKAREAVLIHGIS